MMIERRTGLPIRQKVKLLGTEPYFLTDAILPVIAVRAKRKEKKGKGGGSVFNPVLSPDAFESLFGGS